MDRLWPRGISKQKAALFAWPKEITPATELRKKFHSAEITYPQFHKCYKEQLKSKECRVVLQQIEQWLKQGNVTFIYSSRSTDHNNGLVINEVLNEIRKET